MIHRLICWIVDHTEGPEPSCPWCNGGGVNTHANPATCPSCSREN